jgi:hypothetical protein
MRIWRDKVHVRSRGVRRDSCSRHHVCPSRLTAHSPSARRLCKQSSRRSFAHGLHGLTRRSFAPRPQGSGAGPCHLPPHTRLLTTSASKNRSPSYKLCTRHRSWMLLESDLRAARLPAARGPGTKGPCWNELEKQFSAQAGDVRRKVGPFRRSRRPQSTGRSGPSQVPGDANIGGKCLTRRAPERAKCCGKSAATRARDVMCARRGYRPTLPRAREVGQTRKEDRRVIELHVSRSMTTARPEPQRG